ncbi:MAG: hypothetical protein KC649_03495, partial [Candidatus Omnitrophica bacterium]|nr:hypothetical protein [Candidatus Omnitrophota bacterium]
MNSDISALLPGEMTDLFLNLIPHKKAVSDEWFALHQKVFEGDLRGSGRLIKVYSALTSQLITDLSESNVNHFAVTLKRCSRLFYNMGISFEEVMLSIHLFQEACLNVLVNESLIEEDALIPLRLAFDQIGSAGLQVVSAHYFDAYRTQVKYEISSAHNETERMRNELDLMRSRYESHAKENLQGIHTTMMEITKKLRQDSLLQRTVYRLTLALDRAKNESELLDVAITFFKSILPEKAEVMVLMRQEAIKER